MCWHRIRQKQLSDRVTVTDLKTCGSKKEKITESVIRCVGNSWKRKELVDLTVIVDNIQFECHSLLLGSCSGYFKSLLSSKSPAKKRTVRLFDTEVSAETFQAILNSIYTGASVVNKGTLIDVWRGAHQLDIEFLVTECERFAICNLTLDNYQSIYTTARRLRCSSVLTIVNDFMAKNFNSFKDAGFLARLPFDDFLSIVKHPNLVVKTEDFVIEAILKWLSFLPQVNDPKTTCSSTLTASCMEKSGNSSETETLCSSVAETVLQSNRFNVAGASSGSKLDETLETIPEISSGSDIAEPKSKSEYLITLLMATRTCLLSSHCLSRTFNSEFVASNYLARDILFKASVYQSGCKSHGHWPTPAIHRKYSSFENVGIYLRSNGTFEALSFSRHYWLTNKLYNITSPEVQIEVFDQELYAAVLHNTKLVVVVSLYVFKGSHWVRLCEFPRKSSFQAKPIASSFYSAIEPHNNPHATEHSFLNFGQRRSSYISDSLMMSKVTEISIAPFLAAAIPTATSVNTHAFSSNITSSDPSVSMSTDNPFYGDSATFTSVGSPDPPVSPLAGASVGTLNTESTDGATGKGHSTVVAVVEPQPGNTIGDFATKLKLSPRPPSFAPIILESCAVKLDFSYASTSKQSAGPMSSRIKTTTKRSRIPSEPKYVPGSFHIISHDKSIYYFNSFVKVIFKINPHFSEEITELKYFLAQEKIVRLSSCHELLLVFCTDADHLNKTVVYTFNTYSDEAVKMSTLDGPADGLITFQDDDHKYLLQSNGSLWTIGQCTSNVVQFDLITKLWDFTYRLNSGVFYNGELFLHGENPVIFENREPIYPEIFKRVHVYGQAERCSRFLPFVILKKSWMSKED
ncbi:hypothetical protein Btru_023057 [Bulinus truncatus]|nr:hypothetical protein Btru_023057 [Bulinus truncatus]